MKAITCSQCGALVKEISLKDKFAFCDYCGAKIRLEENKIIEFRPPQPKLKPIVGKDRERLFEQTLRQNNDDNSYNDTKKVINIILVIIFGSCLVFTPLYLAAIFKKREPVEETKPANIRKIVETTPEPVQIYETPKPIPNISYRAYVQYNTNIGADYIEIPTIPGEKLPTDDIKELKKTVFAQRRIRVRVTIDENGEVIDAKAQNGHQILQESSVQAAKKSLFSNRKKQATTMLTYIYILE